VLTCRIKANNISSWAGGTDHAQESTTYIM
jgi:hypothetical protein